MNNVYIYMYNYTCQNIIAWTLRSPRAVSEELESISKELGSKKSHIITQALELYFDELDLEIAERRLKKFENGETDTISADEVWKDLGID